MRRPACCFPGAARLWCRPDIFRSRRTGRRRRCIVYMNVLILEAHADRYAERLRQAFPGLSVHPVQTVYAVKDLETLPVASAAIDVLMAFGISVNDELVRRAVNLKWIQSLATGVDHFVRCPSLRPEV